MNTDTVELKGMTLEELLAEREENSAEIATEIERMLKDAYTAATATLDAEEAALIEEHEGLTVSLTETMRLLPAKAKVAEYEAAQLTLAGKDEEAAAKTREMEEAQAGAEAVRDRQREISGRCEAIELERQTIARQVWRTWLNAMPDVIRPAERFLFLESLDRIKKLSLDFENETGATVFASQNDLNSLTAPERSPEWESGNRWYSRS